MVRPTVACVDLAALQANYRDIVHYLSQSPRPPGVIAVVKANAYGHGAGQVARALEDAGADLLACADIEEGMALRAAGVRAEILVFGALSVSDLDCRFDNLPRTLPAMLASPNLELAAVYTHFATADDPESPLFDEQRLRFARARVEIEAMHRGAREERRRVDRASSDAAPAGDPPPPYVHA